jgi:hypothetical protein
MSKKLPPKMPDHLAIEWLGNEPSNEPMLWAIYDTTVDLTDDRMREAHTNGLLVFGIETKEEAERIVREELKDHVPANIRWWGPTGKPSATDLQEQRLWEQGLLRSDEKLH